MALSHWPQLARDGDGGGTGSVPRCRVSGMALGAGAMESPPISFTPASKCSHLV